MNSEFWPTKKEVAEIRKKYPEGTIIKLLKMDDPTPVPSGTYGIVTAVDGVGQIHCDYLNYRSSLAIVPSKDKFRKVPAIRIIYPCECCPSCVLDMNSPEPYMCHVNGHHSGIKEGLADNCPEKKEPYIVEMRENEIR